MLQEEQEEQEETPKITEDCFLIALEAEDFDRDDGSAKAYLAIFEADMEFVTAYPVPYANGKSKNGNQRNKKARQHGRYIEAIVTALNSSGVKTVVIGDGPPDENKTLFPQAKPKLDKILLRQAKKRKLDIVHVPEDEESEDIEEQAIRLLKIDLLARVWRQHERAGHRSGHLCSGCLYEAMREAVKCLDWYERASDSWQTELSFEARKLFIHVIHLTLWKLLGFKNPPEKEHDLPRFKLPPRKAHKRAIEPLIRQIMDGGSPSEFGAAAHAIAQARRRVSSPS